MTLYQDLKTLVEITQTLELKGEQATLSQDLLLEMVSHQRVSDLRELISHLGMHLGHYLTEIPFKPSEIIALTRRYNLFFTPSEDSCLIVKRDQKGRLCIHHWKDSHYTIYPFKKSTFKNLMGHKEPSGLGVGIASQVQHQRGRKPVQRMLEFLTLESRSLWLIFAYSLAMGFLGLGVPIASQSLVNNVAFGALRQPLLVLCLMLFLTMAFLALMRSLQVVLVEMLQRRILVRVTQDTANRLLRIQSIAFEQHRLPELVNRFFDVVTVQKSASFLLLDGLGILLSTLTGMVLLAFYHPLLLIFDLLLLCAILLILLVLGVGGQSSSIKESGQKYAIAAWLEELAVHPHLFKPSTGGQFAARKTEELLHTYLQARKKHFRVVLRQNVGAFSLQAIAATSLLGLGGWLVIEGQLTIGQLVAAELVVANVVNSFSKVGKHLETWYDLMAAFDKLGYLFDLPQENVVASLLNRTKEPAELRLEKLSYAHPQGIKVLKEINLKCSPGSKTAILGANSWECNTLLELIYSARKPDKGLLLVDGQPLHQLLLSDYRSQVVMVRDLELLETSLLENLRLGNPTLSRQDARLALEQVGLWDKVQNFSHGLDTVLSFNGFPFSQSDAHRVMMARALIMKPRLLILDGVLEQIGWRVEGPLSQALFNKDLSQKTSLLVITNKVEFLSYFDQTYVFNPEGQLVLADTIKLPKPLSQELNS